MNELEYFDGYDFITINLIDIDDYHKLITVAITYLGKISVITYAIEEDDKGQYFEHGQQYIKIYLNDFEEISEVNNNEI